MCVLSFIVPLYFLTSLNISQLLNTNPEFKSVWRHIKVWEMWQLAKVLHQITISIVFLQNQSLKGNGKKLHQDSPNMKKRANGVNNQQVKPQQSAVSRIHRRSVFFNFFIIEPFIVASFTTAVQYNDKMCLKLRHIWKTLALIPKTPRSIQT